MTTDAPLIFFTVLAAKDFDGVLISLSSSLLAWLVGRLFDYDLCIFVPPMMYNNCGDMGLSLAVLASCTARP